MKINAEKGAFLNVPRKIKHATRAIVLRATYILPPKHATKINGKTDQKRATMMTPTLCTKACHQNRPKQMTPATTIRPSLLLQNPKIYHLQ